MVWQLTLTAVTAAVVTATVAVAAFAATTTAVTAIAAVIAAAAPPRADAAKNQAAEAAADVTAAILYSKERRKFPKLGRLRGPHLARRCCRGKRKDWEVMLARWLRYRRPSVEQHYKQDNTLRCCRAAYSRMVGR